MAKGRRKGGNTGRWGNTLLVQMVFLGDGKVVLTFYCLCLDQKTVSDIRNERVGGRAFYRGVHASDFEAIGENAGGHRVGIGNEFPKWMSIFVRFKFGQ